MMWLQGEKRTFAALIILDTVITDASGFAYIDPLKGISTLPFLFSSLDEAWKIMDLWKNKSPSAESESAEGKMLIRQDT